MGPHGAHLSEVQRVRDQVLEAGQKSSEPNERIIQDGLMQTALALASSPTLPGAAEGNWKHRGVSFQWG